MWRYGAAVEAYALYETQFELVMRAGEYVDEGDYVNWPIEQMPRRKP